MSEKNIDIRTHEQWQETYYELKDARNSARDNERKIQLGYTDLTTTPLWESVVNHAQNILNANIYDLEVAVWLTEASFRIQGLDGLNNGFDIILDLITDHWENLNPMPDEDGLSTRLISLYGLNGIESEGSLIQPLREIMITNSDSDDNYYYAEYKNSLALEKKSEHKSNPESLYKKIQKSSQLTNNEFYSDLKNSLNTALEKYTNIIELLDKLCLQDSPPSSYIKTTLKELLECVSYLYQDQTSEPKTEQNIEINSESKNGASKNKSKSKPKLSNKKSSNKKNIADITEISTVQYEEHDQEDQIKAIPIKSREHALDLLQVISDYFTKTEPHSPLPFLINRTIKWGNMALPELLAEMITDRNARDNTCHLTGVPSVQSSGANTGVNSGNVQNNIQTNNNTNNLANPQKITQSKFT